jgi:uncharacterized membrane protein
MVKFDWQIFIICMGLIVIITTPIGIYIKSPENFIMSFAIGLILGCIFLRWGVKLDE